MNQKDKQMRIIRLNKILKQHDYLAVIKSYNYFKKITYIISSIIIEQMFEHNLEKVLKEIIFKFK